MGYLVAGLVIWSVVHFIPSLGISFKKSLIARFGENPYKAIFSILIVLSLVMIVIGWRSTVPTYFYVLPVGVKPLALLLMVVAFILFGAAKYQTRIKQFVRHPQLTGVIVWAIAHLLLNGDSRSVLLFGWLGVWAIVEIILINKRQGAWVKSETPGWGQELKGVVISLVILVVVVFLHPYIAGVPVR